MMTPADSDYAAFPAWVREAERDLIAARRAAADCATSRVTDREEDRRIGLALSGGGIRSATFCLGMLRALAHAKLAAPGNPRGAALRWFDYLSSVSGGGYVGSFLGALYARPNPGGGVPADRIEKTLGGSTDAGVVRWLRDNGRYLAPSGSAGSWAASATLLRNWFALAGLLFLGAFSAAYVGVACKAVLLRVAARILGVEPTLSPVVHGFAVSPFFLVSAIALVFGAGPCGVAYWFIPTGTGLQFRFSFAVLVALIACLLGFAFVPPVAYQTLPMVGLALWVVVAVCVWASASGWRMDRDGTQRFRTTRGMTISLRIAFGLAMFAVVDSLGESLTMHLTAGDKWVAAGFAGGFATAVGAATPVVSSANRILALLGDAKRQQPATPSVTLRIGVDVLATVILLAGGAFTSFAVHAVVCNGGSMDQRLLTFSTGHLRAVLGVLAAVAVAQFPSFVNGSSLSRFYATRLARTYLGASNPARLAGTVRGAFSRTEPVPGDRLALNAYKPHEHGGPLHIINVTVNETYDARSELLEPDRSGLPMALGPGSLSVGVHHHARIEAVDAKMRLVTRPHVDPPNNDKPFRVFPPQATLESEALDLADWVAVSGAAVAPGLGRETRLARSLLLTVFNLRLGRWWDSGVDRHARTGAKLPGRRTLAERFPAYEALVREAAARFSGVARRSWYLSDGGHFDNTACYELLRRRLPLIMCCDAGADPEYLFEDVGNLVRIARVDFGAEIRFLDDAALTSFLAPVRHPGARCGEARLREPRARDVQ
jgi:hypothetical protein